MHTICMHSHLPGEHCELMKPFPFCSWLATFGPCCSFPHRSWLSGTCQGSFGKSKGSKLPFLTEYHSPTMPLGGKIVQTSFSCHDEFSWSYKSAGMGEEVPLQPVVPSIPVSFSSLLDPLAYAEASMLGTATVGINALRRGRGGREMRGSEVHLPMVPRFPEMSSALAKNISQAAQTLSLPHTSLVQTVTANPKIAELDKYREKGLQISEMVTNSSAR